MYCKIVVNRCKYWDYSRWRSSIWKSTSVGSFQLASLSMFTILYELEQLSKHSVDIPNVHLPFQSILLQLVRVRQGRNTQMFRAFMASSIKGLRKLRLLRIVSHHLNVDHKYSSRTYNRSVWSHFERDRSFSLGCTFIFIFISFLSSKTVCIVNCGKIISLTLFDDWCYQFLLCKIVKQYFIYE